VVCRLPAELLRLASSDVSLPVACRRRLQLTLGDRRDAQEPCRAILGRVPAPGPFSCPFWLADTAGWKNSAGMGRSGLEASGEKGLGGAARLLSCFSQDRTGLDGTASLPHRKVSGSDEAAVSDKGKKHSPTSPVCMGSGVSGSIFHHYSSPAGCEKCHHDKQEVQLAETEAFSLNSDKSSSILLGDDLSLEDPTACPLGRKDSRVSGPSGLVGLSL